MTSRLFIAAVALLGIYAGVRWAKDFGMPTQIAPLEMKVQDLPTTLGDWKGEDVALDPDIFTQIGAEMAVDRQYRNQRGGVVSVHVAVFGKTDYITGLPHSPDICYPASGYKLGDPKYISLDADATQNEAKFQNVVGHGKTEFLFYWYQIDGAAYCRGDRQRKLLLACRGRPLCPPIVKVMMQASAANPEDAEKTMKSLAAEVFKWSRGFH